MKIFNTKLYILEEMTQEDLNNLVLERNTLVKENARLKYKLKNIEKMLESNHDIEYIYCALCQYLNMFDYELDLEKF